MRLQAEEELFSRLVKKFGQSSKAWTLFGQFYLTRGRPDEARDLLPRSLKSLEKRKRELSRFHIELIDRLTGNFDLQMSRRFLNLLSSNSNWATLNGDEQSLKESWTHTLSD